jgi:hypothetical protein
MPVQVRPRVKKWLSLLAGTGAALAPSSASQSQIWIYAKKQSSAREHSLNLRVRQTKCGQLTSSAITGLIYWVLFSKIFF